MRTIALGTLLILMAGRQPLAQTVEFSASLAALGWGAVSAQRVDTDGVSHTAEFLVEQYNPWTPGVSVVRVAALRDGRVCASPWFTVTYATDKWVIRAGPDGKSRLEVPGHYSPPFLNQPVQTILLHTPPC